MKHKINIMSGQSMPLPTSDRRIALVTIGEGGQGMGVFARAMQSDDLDHLISIRRDGGCGDVLSHLLNGRDCMLVPVRDLDDVALKLARLGCATNDENRVELFMMQSYLDGIIHARLCLLAAGLEAAAA